MRVLTIFAVLLCIASSLAFPFIPLPSKRALERAANDPRAPPFKECAALFNWLVQSIKNCHV